MSNPKVISFQVHLDEFYFMGIENLVTENADFGAFWGNFFDREDMIKLIPISKTQTASMFGIINQRVKKSIFRAKLLMNQP